MRYLFILLLRIVAYLEGINKIISFLILLLLMSYSIIIRKGIILKMSKKTIYLSLVICAIIIQSLIFGNILIRDVAILATYWIWFVFVMKYFKTRNINEGLKYILISFLIYNVVNLVFYELYFSDLKLGYNGIMQIFGIVGYRAYFPLSSGANIFTSQLSLCALITLHFIRNSKRPFFYWILYLFHVFVLIIADSRLILFLTLVFSFFYWNSLDTILKIIKRYWYLISLGLIIFLYVFYSTSIFEFLKRGGEKTGSALSRIEIWTLSLNVIFDGPNLLWGHGLNGFENSLNLESVQSFENQNLKTSHNFILQNFIDYGLIGIMIILFYLGKLIKKANALKSRIIFVLLVMVLLFGTTESIPSFYSFEPTLFFIALGALIIRNYERKIN